MRAPVDTIAAPPFPADLPWVNVAPLRMDKQVGRPVLVEFWDFCRPNSLRTLPYVRAWHERYAADGLRVISVHTPGFAPSRDEAAVRAAVARLGIEHPVCIDADGLVWSLTTTRAGRRATSSTRPRGCTTSTSARAATRRPSARSRSCSGSSASRSPRCAPRTIPRRGSSSRRRTSPGRGAGPTSPGRSGRSSTAAARSASNGTPIAVEHPGAYELSAPGQHRGRARPRGRRRGRVPRGLLRAGPAPPDA